MRRFLGLPALIWGSAFLALAVIWGFVWPSEQAAEVAGMHFFLLRWGHALTWLLLALAAFSAGSGRPALVKHSKHIAQLGLLAYLGFVLALVLS